MDSPADPLEAPVPSPARTLTMTRSNTQSVLSRLALPLLLLAPTISCECESESFIDPGGESSGSSIADLLIVLPGTGYEVGDDVTFSSVLLQAAGTGAAAFISEVDADGGVTEVEFDSRGEGYLVAPTASVTSEEGKGCVLLPDLRVVEICMDNANEESAIPNGTMNLSVPKLFGETILEVNIRAICFSELGSDICLLTANGTLPIEGEEGNDAEIEVTLVTSTLDEFVDQTDHHIKAGGEGMIIAYKFDADGDGEYEFAEGEIVFHTAMGGAIMLTSATIDIESESFSSGISGLLDGSIGLSGSIEFDDCD